MISPFLKLLLMLLITVGLLLNLSCSEDDNPVEAPNNPPVVTIVTPHNNANYFIGDTLTFTATATDIEDGELSDSSFIWISDIDGQIGVGKSITASGLSANRHNITLIASDRNNNTDSAQITISIFVTFEKLFGGLSEDYGQSVIETSDGGFLITGYTSSYGEGYYDVYLIKVNKNGIITWENTFGSRHSEYGYSVIETSDGSFLLTGKKYTFGIQLNDLDLIKVDNSGNFVWEKTFGGAKDETGYSICETSDGGFIIAGVTESYEPIGENVYLVKTDNSGNLIWEKTFGGFSDDVGYSVCNTSDGGFIITGTTRLNGLVNRYVYIVKTDFKGDLVWDNHFGGFNDDYGYSVKEVSDGGYIIAGSTTSSGAGSFDVYLIKTDKNGRLIWEKPLV